MGARCLPLGEQVRALAWTRVADEYGELLLVEQPKGQGGYGVRPSKVWCLWWDSRRCLSQCRTRLLSYRGTITQRLTDD